MDNEFKVGDVVRLKSGGPNMTIEGIGKYGPVASDDSANCVWFEKTNRKQGVFELSTIMPAQPRQTHGTIERA
jgi:uncharacterized protein YodC (DUF2158 family)